MERDTDSTPERIAQIARREKIEDLCDYLGSMATYEARGNADNRAACFRQAVALLSELLPP